MSEKSLSAGDYIAAKCTKCKDRTNHTIVAMVGTQVVKVQCNTCGSEHKYRAAVSPKQPSSRATRTAAPRTNKAQRDWEALLDGARPEEAVPYRMATPMREGLLILHPNFGLGQVLKCIKPNKMEVQFQSGVKLLRCTIG